ncbi:MAG: hypothetical protein ACFCVH_12555 [Alphaproteobacteria bacterium]
MLTTKQIGLRHLTGFAVLALALGVAACNEEGTEATDQTGPVPMQEDPMATPQEPMAPVEPAPAEPTQ